MRFITELRDYLWGMPTVVAVSAFGLYFTLKTGLFNPLALPRAFKRTFFAPRKGGGGGFSSLAAISTALGGTVGVGSISGVALAISLGGAGSIFWMWVCAFLGMGLKYAEVALAHRRRVITPRGPAGGTMYCLNAMGYKRLAALFALLTVMGAAAGGSLVQAGAISSVLKDSVNSTAVCAIAVAAATLLVISGGRRFIGTFNTMALPVVSVLFTVLCLAVIAANIKALPSALGRIIGEAFGYRQAAGGISGALMVRVGCTRGTFSHEAGMGSSPISYAAAAETSSHTQGLWGVTEVFIDTFVVSTLVALCLLCTGAKTAADIFTLSFGGAGGVFYTVAIVVFAFAAIVSWCFYGEEALYYLRPQGGKPHGVFKLAVAGCAFAGAMMTENGAFAAADIWGALMLFPNLYLLYKARREIIELAK